MWCDLRVESIDFESKYSNRIHRICNPIFVLIKFQIKEVRGLRRSLEKVDGEWHLIDATHNLLNNSTNYWKRSMPLNACDVSLLLLWLKLLLKPTSHKGMMHCTTSLSSFSGGEFPWSQFAALWTLRSVMRSFLNSRSPFSVIYSSEHFFGLPSGLLTAIHPWPGRWTCSLMSGQTNWLYDAALFA